MSVYERVNNNTDLGDLYHVLEKLLVSSDFFNQLKEEPYCSMGIHLKYH